ncbi:hypothetical protein HanPI659440_Chr17g0672671 [Helianthus annuus]|nr:hypothetical protein HanPI659440_Chr17g0672671 [Helianthus annuus]
MRVVHFELSCVAVSGEPSFPLFCMFYKLISDGDWFTFSKRKNCVSPPCYSFMPTSTYPNEWKSRFIFVSIAMIPESPPLRDPKAVIEDSVPVLSADKIVQWKRMCENPTRAFTFLERVLAMGGLSPFYSVRPKAFFGKKEMTLWGLLQGYCKDVKFMDSAVEGKDEEGSSGGKEDSPGSLRVKGSSDDDYDEDLKSGLFRKRKAAQTSSPKLAPAPRNIRLRLQSASGQKTFPATKAASKLPPVVAKGSLSKHLRSSSLINEPLLGSLKAPIEIPTAPSSSRVCDKTPEISVARITPAFDVSPLRATGTSKPSHPEGLVSQSPLAPLFADAFPVPYIPRWKITPSTVVGTPETARDFLAHVVPNSHKFMNSALRPDLFDDQYSMSLCGGFFRGAGMLQRMDELRRENEELKAELKTSQTVAVEVRCRVTNAERRLLEKKQRESAWARQRERMALVDEKEELVTELRRQKELDSVSQGDLHTMYAEWGMVVDDNRKLAKERYWLITEGFESFLDVVSQSEKFKGSLERIYRAYRDVGY